MKYKKLMDYLEINRKLWDQRTGIHYDSEFYDVPSFLEGKDSLNPIELDLLGELKGKKVLHLQCHFGQDTISLSRRGAQATGVDFSEKAIARARELSEKTGTDTRFIQSDIFGLKDILDESFDIVFTSYGVLGWLPDMKIWAKTVHHFLKPGGVLVLAEFHPVVWMFSDDFKKIAFNYSDRAPITEVEQGTYTNPEADIQEESITWNHGLSEVIQNLIRAGMRLEEFHEYDYSPYDCFAGTVKIEEGQYQIKGLEEKIPMVYSVKAIKN